MSRINFKKYKFDKSVFVETGTYHGDGVVNACYAGFEQIHSIEISEYLYNFSFKRFKFPNLNVPQPNYDNVHLYHGDSSVILYDVIKNIDNGILFWLDGHYSMGDTEHSHLLAMWEYPLVFEIQQIAKHHIKDHVILIDDLRCFPTLEQQNNWGFKANYSVDILKNEILKINPDYKFYKLDGFVPNDILLATVNSVQ